MENKKVYPKKFIISAVAEAFSVSEGDIFSRTRKKDIVQARQVLAYCLRHLNNMSFPDIAKILGGRDHTTAIYSFRRVIRKMGISESYNKMVASIVNYIKNSGQGEIIQKPKPAAEFYKELLAEKKNKEESAVREGGGSPTYVRNLNITEREKSIMSEYRKGKTLQEISYEFNVTRERIRQIVFKVNMKEIGAKSKDGFEIDANEYIKGEKQAHENAKKGSSDRHTDCSNYVEKVASYTSISNFARDVGLSVDRLTRICPEVIEKINRNVFEKKNRWSRNYIMCRGCGTTKIPHMRKGYCERCIGISSLKTRRSLLKEDSKCASCGIDRGSAIRELGRDFYLVKDGRILCRKCFLKFTGSKLSASRRNRS